MHQHSLKSPCITDTADYRGVYFVVYISKIKQTNALTWNVVYHLIFSTLIPSLGRNITAKYTERVPVTKFTFFYVFTKAVKMGFVCIRLRQSYSFPQAYLLSRLVFILTVKRVITGSSGLLRPGCWVRQT